MSTQTTRSPELATLLGSHQEEIATAWAEMVYGLADTPYSRRPIRELRTSTTRGVQALTNALATGSGEAIEAYLNDISMTRLNMGFDISNVVGALLLLRRAAMPILRQNYAPAPTELHRADECLDAWLRYSVSRLAHLYAQAASYALHTEHERTALILEVTAAANSSLDLDQVLQQALEKSSETFGLGCTIYTWHPYRGVLIQWIGKGSQDHAGAPVSSDLVLAPKSTAALNAIVDQGQPVFCYGRHCQDCAAISEALGMASVLIVPIAAGDQALVAFIGDTADVDPDLTETDIQLAAGMANAVGLAVKNAQLFERTRQRLTEIESIHRMTTALLQSLTLDQVLEVVQREACQMTKAKGCALFSLVEGDWLEAMHSGGILKPPARRMPVKGTLNGQVLSSGEPLLANDPHSLQQTSHPFPDLDSLLIIPMTLRGDVVGTMDVADKPGGFTQDDVRILGLFADGAAIAIESARLHQQAEQLAVMEERQRLARELHDSVTQTLYSVTLYAEATQMAMSAGKQEAALENLRQLHQMAREAMIDMRMLIFELHPPVLEKEGLVIALQRRLAAVEARAGLSTEVKVSGQNRLPLPMEEELFWIALEAFNNVVKHANARRVVVSLDLSSSDNVRLVIQDDGHGFDVQQAKRTGGMGLPGMQERVDRIRGELQIVSKPVEGTTVTVEAEIR